MPGQPESPNTRTTMRRPSLRRENMAGLLFMVPWILGFLLVVAGPMVASLYLSFTDYSALGIPGWIGLDNYIRMFTDDPRFLDSLRVTLTYLVASVPLVVGFALVLAINLNRGIRGLTFYRALFYVPSLIGGSVAVAILWRAVFQGNGVLNSSLRFLGIDIQRSWIGEPDTALWTLVVLNVWQFGAAMIIFLAGLRQIPAELIDAARVDGASRWRTLRSVVLPMLSPIIFFNVLMQTVGAFQAFNSAYIISGGTGGPANSTLFYTLYLYQQGFVNFDMGYASALGWVLLLMVATAAGLLFATTRRFVHYGDS